MAAPDLSRLRWLWEWLLEVLSWAASVMKRAVARLCVRGPAGRAGSAADGACLGQVARCSSS